MGRRRVEKPELECRRCGCPLTTDEAVWLTAANRKARKPACQHCYELAIIEVLDDREPRPRPPGAPARLYQGIDARDEIEE
jgi:hypothetical protein